MATLYSYQDSNTRKTFLLMTFFFVGVIALGFLFSQILQSPVILYGAIIFSIVMNVVSYWYSDKIALAMSGARALKREEALPLYRIVENLAITAGLPLPCIYIIPGTQINAFATGRDAKHAAVAVTAGALEKLDKNELEGVIAHELSHVGNRDILLSTVVVVLAGVISIMAEWFLRFSFWGGGRRSRDDKNNAGSILFILGIVAAILAPIAAMLVQLAISRRREFLADTSGALLTRYPEGLASALEKISHDGAVLPTARSSTAHLFLTNPFKGKDGASWFAKLFMTHPPLEERIKILRGLHI